METHRPAVVSRRAALAGLGAGSLSLALAVYPFRAVAQDALAPAGPGTAARELAPGATMEVFAGVPSARATGQTLHLIRLVFQPGAETSPHGHPGTVLLSVASGSFGFTLVEGTARVLRGAATGATGAAEDLTVPGTDVVLKPGDAITYEDDVVHTARGAGTEPAVVLGTFVLTAGQPLAMPPGTERGGTAPVRKREGPTPV